MTKQQFTSHMSEYAKQMAIERRKKRQREHYNEQRAAIDQARQTMLYDASANAGRITCDLCPHLEHCQAVVWTGALLPCQPQGQDVTLMSREYGDMAMKWQLRNAA